MCVFSVIYAIAMAIKDEKCVDCHIGELGWL